MYILKLQFSAVTKLIFAADTHKSYNFILGLGKTKKRVVILLDIALVLSSEELEAVEQSEGIGKVNNAVLQMDQVTQRNAANPEETASASEEMSTQASTLKEQVNILAA